MKLSASVRHLKRNARDLSRRDGIPLHAALDHVAETEGFKRWSLLMARASFNGYSSKALERLSPGDLVLLGARPGQGKTLMSLSLIMQAAREARPAFFFTLEWTLDDVLRRVRQIGEDPTLFTDRVTFDDSNAICADYVVDRLAGTGHGAVVAIDYLQLLDQRRENPGLMEQMTILRKFASAAGVTMILISQIDRSYDPEQKSCPGLTDIRLPNPLDLRLFDKTCFLQGGEMQISAI